MAPPNKQDENEHRTELMPVNPTATPATPAVIAFARPGWCVLD